MFWWCALGRSNALTLHARKTASRNAACSVRTLLPRTGQSSAQSKPLLLQLANLAATAQGPGDRGELIL